MSPTPEPARPDSAALSGPGRLHDLTVSLEAASPGEIKAGGEGWKIRAGHTNSPFGDCLIAATPRGICRLDFVENRKRHGVEKELLADWPRAEIYWDDSEADSVGNRIFQQTGVAKNRVRCFINGSQFQICVWRALLRIPAGLLATYQQIATAIGKPDASRAVGTAIGSNPVGYLIPCHRVIRKTGIVGQYRWGNVRKHTVIARELSQTELQVTYRTPPLMKNTGLKLASKIADEFLESLETAPLQSTASVDALRSQFASELSREGQAPNDVIAHLSQAVEGGLSGSAGGRFFAWVIGGGLESALAADWLTATWDQNAALSACSPAAAVAEEVVGRWLKDLLGLASKSYFALTTGCQMAHITCLAAARNAVLSSSGWNVESKGLCRSPAIVVVCNEHRHGSIDKAVRLLGLGSESLHPVSTDSGGRMKPDALAEALKNRDGPKNVVLTAGDINTGCIDPFENLISAARKYDAWVHIDGAFGLLANASRSRRHLLAGVEAADNWATDAHKWLNVPLDCGFAFVQNEAAHRASMTTGGSYVSASSEVRDQIDWNPEWSRRVRGFPVYAALLELGRDGVEQLIDRCCRLAVRLVEGLAALPRTEVLWRPTLNQGLVRFLHSADDASESDLDRVTDEMIAAINSTSEAFFSGTTWKGRRAMRVSVINWRMCDANIDRTVSAIAGLL